MLKEFEELLDGSDGRFTGGEITIELEKDANVIFQLPYRLPDTRLSSNWMMGFTYGSGAQTGWNHDALH